MSAASLRRVPRPAWDDPRYDVVVDGVVVGHVDRHVHTERTWHRTGKVGVGYTAPGRRSRRAPSRTGPDVRRLACWWHTRHRITLEIWVDDMTDLSIVADQWAHVVVAYHRQCRCGQHRTHGLAYDPAR